jgi:hypothetical protein
MRIKWVEENLRGSPAFNFDLRTLPLSQLLSSQTEHIPKRNQKDVNNLTGYDIRDRFQI